MPLYLCRRWDGFARAQHHSALKWVKPAELERWPMPPADAPLIAYLRDFL
jgi:8-oxo-dGTP diphosphatase